MLPIARVAAVKHHQPVAKVLKNQLRVNQPKTEQAANPRHQ